MKHLTIITILLCALFNYNIGASVTRTKRNEIGWAVDDYGCRTLGGGMGECISIKKCKSFQNFVPNRDSYVCGSEGDQFKVCCPHELPLTLPTPSTFDLSQHPNIPLLPTKDICGRTVAFNRMLVGNQTGLFEFPWMAALKFDTSRYNPYACGASIISKRYLLTAAHCVRSDTKLVSARLGEYNFLSSKDCVEEFNGPKTCAEEPQDFEISSDDAIVHPQYDEKKLLNDIALIRLPREAVLNDESVVPICLPILKSEKEHTYENYTVIGWGNAEIGFSSHTLLKALVPIVDNSICASQYQRQIQVTENQLCAGGKSSQDDCIGDSGNPLSNEYVDEDRTIRTIQYGLLSMRPLRHCGKQPYPIIYTKIANYVQWILDNIKP